MNSLKAAALVLTTCLLAACAPAKDQTSEGSPNNAEFNTGIVGGTLVATGTALSKQVALLDKRCTATFIDRHIALTAAHCFPERNTSGTLRFINAEKLANGETKFETTFETAYDDVVINPEFDPYMNTFGHDLALVRTVDALPEGFVITPLATRMTLPKLNAVAAGRGLRNYPQQLGPQLANDQLLRTVDLKNLELVKNGAGSWYKFLINLNAGVSSGDSGGPLFADEDGVTKQIGVASTIKDSMSGEDVAYAPVAQNLAWIKRASSELLAEKQF